MSQLTLTDIDYDTIKTWTSCTTGKVYVEVMQGSERAVVSLTKKQANVLGHFLLKAL